MICTERPASPKPLTYEDFKLVRRLPILGSVNSKSIIKICKSQVMKLVCDLPKYFRMSCIIILQHISHTSNNNKIQTYIEQKQDSNVPYFVELCEISRSSHYTDVLIPIWKGIHRWISS